MAKAAVQQGGLQGIEYSIYTFASDSNGSNKWKKHSTVLEMDGAMKEAASLFESGKFDKIEIKQKYFDKKKNRNIDLTLKIFESKKKKEISTAPVLIFALLAGMAAFAVTYFLNK